MTEAKKKVRFGDAWRGGEGARLAAPAEARARLRPDARSGGWRGWCYPRSSKFLIDEVLAKGRAELLLPLALAAGLATLVQARLLVHALAASRASRRSARSPRCASGCTRTCCGCRRATSTPTKSGELISRVMNDAEGIRNLVGTGLVQLAGGFLTAGAGARRPALAQLAADADQPGGDRRLRRRCSPSPSGGCGRSSASAARSRREVIGRLGESMGGVRVVKAYTAEPEEERVFGVGVERLFANVRKTMTGISWVTAASTGADRGRSGRCCSSSAAASILAGGDDARRPRHVRLLHRPARRPRGGDRRRSAPSSPRRSPGSTASARSSARRPRTPATRRWRRSTRCAATSSSSDVSLRVRSGPAGPARRLVPRRGGHHDGARRLLRLGQEHAHRPRHRLPPAAVAARSWSTAAISPSCGCATTARTSARSSRTTSCSTARSPRTSPTRGPAPARDRDRRRGQASRTATSS